MTARQLIRGFLAGFILTTSISAHLAQVGAEEAHDPPNAAAWPTYRCDNQRSGLTPESLDLPLQLIWRRQSRQAPAPAWPPPARQDFWRGKSQLPARVTFDRAYQPVSDGRLVVFGSSADDRVYCLDLATGEEKWSFCTEGPVRLAPRIAGQGVYATSDDGRLYCLQLEDGKPQWIFQPLSRERRLPGNGRIISAWPARTGVLLEDGVLQLAVGLFPQQGVYQFAVDATSGKKLAESQIGFSPQGYLQRTPEGIVVRQGRSPTALLTRLQRRGAADSPTLGVSPLKDTLALIGAGDLRFASADQRVVAYDADSKETRWSVEVDGRAYGLAVAGGCLLVSTDRGSLYCFRGANSHIPAVAGDARVIGFARQSFGHADRSIQQWRQKAATQIASALDVRCGYALVLGAKNAGLAYELATRTELQTIVSEVDAAVVAKARAALHPTGLGGRVSVHHLTTPQFPYADALFDVVICLSDGRAVADAKELGRLLTPGRGRLLVLPSADAAVGEEWRKAVQAWLQPTNIPLRIRDRAWCSLQRPALANAGEWTHMYAHPDNTACSGDQIVQGPLQLQWFGPPGPREMVDRHHRTAPPLYSEGRLFVPGNNRLIAVNAYNGAPLWSRELAGMRRVGIMRDAGGLVAAPDLLYVAAARQCFGLDSETGRETLHFSVPAAADGQPRDWGYLARVGDELYGSATKPGASRSGHAREQIKETYYDHVPIVTSDYLFCVDRHTGAVRWKYQPRSGAVLNPTIALGGPRMYFLESANPATLLAPTGRSKLSEFLASAFLVALDRNTGETIWRRQIDLAQLEHHVYLAYSQERLLLVGSRNGAANARTTVWYDIYGLSAESGEVLWKAEQDQEQSAGGDHGEQDHHPVIVANQAYVEPFCYDLATGKRSLQWRLRRGGHGCGAMSASASACFFRAGNPAMCDLQSGKVQRITSVSRPGCWINMIPAGGLLLIPEASSGCTCNFPIQASLAFAPAEFGTFDTPPRAYSPPPAE